MASCCSVPASKGEDVHCHVCQQKGHAVQKMTPESLLREPLQKVLKATGNYFFCPTSTCDVVYFSNETNEYFRKADLKVRVGLKETESPIPVCYCFDYSRERIFEEIRSTGESSALAFFTGKVKNGECECETKNPSGRCCLGEVKKTIKSGKSLNEVAEIL